MAGSGRWTPLVLGCLLAVAGCVPLSSRCCSPPGVLLPSRGELPFPSCEREALAIDGITLPHDPATTLQVSPTLPRFLYYRLTAGDVQKYAASASFAAAQYEQAAVQAGSRPGLLCLGHSAGLTLAQLLLATSREERSRAVVEALDLYYRLAEAEATWDLLHTVRDSVRDSREKLQAIKRQGLEVPSDETDLDRQLLDLHSQIIGLRLRIENLNADLRRQMGFTACTGQFFAWPADAFHLPIPPLDIEKAVAVGLSSRQDLTMLSVLEDAVRAGQLKRLCRLLKAGGGQDPSSPPPSPALITLTRMCQSLCNKVQIEQQLEYLSQLRADRQDQVADEVRQAVRSVQAQISLIHLARQKRESWQQRLTQLEEKDRRDLGDFSATAQARTEMLRAEQKVIEEMIRLQRAWVQLLRAQGTLLVSTEAPCGVQ